MAKAPLAGAVPVRPDVVRASPTAVWDALLSVETLGDAKLHTEAAWKKGGPGTIGAELHLRRGAKSWVERVVESTPGARLRLEVLGSAESKGDGEQEWRLQPIKIGTLLVFDYRGANPWKTFLLKFTARSYARRFVRAVKARAEGKAPAPPARVAGPSEGDAAPAAPAPRKARAKAGKA